MCARVLAFGWRSLLPPSSEDATLEIQVRPFQVKTVWGPPCEPDPTGWSSPLLLPLGLARWPQPQGNPAAPGAHPSLVKGGRHFSLGLEENSPNNKSHTLPRLRLWEPFIFFFNTQKFWPILYNETSCHVGEITWQRTEGYLLPTANKKIEDLSPTTHKELNPAKNHVSIKVDPSLVRFSDETLVLADTLITAFWCNRAWTEDPAKLCPNSWTAESMR